jgi:hypothetical protein
MAKSEAMNTPRKAGANTSWSSARLTVAAAVPVEIVQKC